MENTDLLQKYNTAAPRYTSYPTVPYWETTQFSEEKWKEALLKSYEIHRLEGISLYIHLPFCESLCTYCGCNTRITKNHGVEIPYIDTLIAEWEMYCALLGEKPKIKEIHLGGGTPTFFSPENLKRLLSHILGSDTSNAACSFEGHPANTTATHLKVLNQLGFKRLSLGIQDFDPKVQFMINRYQSPEQVLEVVKVARETGYESINFDLIYGLPGQTEEGLKETMTETLRMRPDRIAFYSYAHVPWLKPGQRHFDERDIPQGDEKAKLYELGREWLTKSGYHEIGMDHFALQEDGLYVASKQQTLHRNFMGYTDRYTPILIGLGVSSISDCHFAFAQNAKTVEGYIAQVNAQKLPVEKGHVLTKSDLVIRQQILNLMCRGNTEFEGQIPNQVLHRLMPMIADQLIEIDGTTIVITQTGKRFLRNICMAFDERLWEKQLQNNVFSNAV